MESKGKWGATGPQAGQPRHRPQGFTTAFGGSATTATQLRRPSVLVSPLPGQVRRGPWLSVATSFRLGDRGTGLAMALGTAQNPRRIPREERVLWRKAGWTLPQSARPAITRPRRRGGLHDRRVSSPIVEGRSKAGALAGLAPSAECRGGTGPRPLSLACRWPPSPFVFTWHSLSVHVCFSPFSDCDTIPMGLRPTPKNPYEPRYLL